MSRTSTLKSTQLQQMQTLSKCQQRAFTYTYNKSRHGLGQESIGTVSIAKCEITDLSYHIIDSVQNRKLLTKARHLLEYVQLNV